MQVLTVQALERNALVRLIADKGLGISVLIGLVFWNLSGQTVAIGAMVMLWAFWRFLPIDEGPPGLPFSCSFHLTQIVIGVFYFGITGRSLEPMLAPQFDRMMWLALLSIGATALGFILGNHWVKGGIDAPPKVRLDASVKQLVVTYFVVVLTYDIVFRFAYQIPLFTQAILALLAVQGGFCTRPPAALPRRPPVYGPVDCGHRSGARLYRVLFGIQGTDPVGVAGLGRGVSPEKGRPLDARRGAPGDGRDAWYGVAWHPW